MGKEPRIKYSFSMELVCTAQCTLHIESEVIIIAFTYCSWNCIAFVTLFKLYWLSSTDIIVLLPICMDDDCSSRNAVNAKQITNHSWCSRGEKNYEVKIHVSRSPIYRVERGKKAATIDAIIPYWSRTFGFFFFFFSSNFELKKIGPMAKSRQKVRFQWI